MVLEGSRGGQNEVKNQEIIAKKRSTTKTQQTNTKHGFSENAPSQFGPRTVQNWSGKEVGMDAKGGEIAKH